ncbi:MAG: BrnT family toxin [Alphaproteobacteria bacterium]|nr:BrnT family toxin [Alphaproteobacteria bacterium]
MDFQWDETKRLVNRRKHGVDFVAAAAAFGDPHGIESLEESAGEERWRLIAMSPSGLLFVVYTMRGESIRIFSARKATLSEARTYHSRQAD